MQKMSLLLFVLFRIARVRECAKKYRAAEPSPKPSTATCPVDRQLEGRYAPQESSLMCRRSPPLCLAGVSGTYHPVLPLEEAKCPAGTIIFGDRFRRVYATAVSGRQMITDRPDAGGISPHADVTLARVQDDT